MINFIILIFMTLFGALGGFFLKKATTNGIKLQKIFIINFFIGGMFYFGGALLNVILLQFMPYTIVYPLTSTTYLWTLIISYYFFSERITKQKITGVFLIILGAFIISN